MVCGKVCFLIQTSRVRLVCQSITQKFFANFGIAVEVIYMSNKKAQILTSTTTAVTFTNQMHLFCKTNKIRMKLARDSGSGR